MNENRHREIPFSLASSTNFSSTRHGLGTDVNRMSYNIATQRSDKKLYDAMTKTSISMFTYLSTNSLFYPNISFADVLGPLLVILPRIFLNVNGG